MDNKMIRTVFAITVSGYFLLLSSGSSAQNSAAGKANKGDEVKEGKHPRLPSWVKMMDDPHVNYYKAVKSFNKYWRRREAPEEEGEEKREACREKRESEEREEGRKKPAPPGMYYYYNKFKRWKVLTEPYVKPDGSLFTAEERKEHWRKQLQGRSVNR